MFYLHALLDSGALGHSYISQSLADKLSFLPRNSEYNVGTFADGSEWVSLWTLQVPLRLLLHSCAMPNKDISISCMVVPSLSYDVIIGALDIVASDLFDVLENVLVNYRKSHGASAKLPSSEINAIPFINGSEADEFPELEAYPLGDDALTKDVFPYDGPPELRDWVKSLVDNYDDVFITAVRENCAKVKPLEIKLRRDAAFDGPKFQQKLRPQCPEFDKEIRAQVSELKNLRVIRSATGPNHCQVLLVRKADGSLRFCIDYRPINDITEPIHYPLPTVQSIFDALKGSKYFSVLDLTSGYHQCPLHPDSVPFSRFLTPSGAFEFERVPFGLKQAPAYFQRAMVEEVLVGLINDICICYIDDVIIFGKTPEEIKARTEMVLQRFRKFNIGIKKSKCRFGLTQVQYVGHIISADGVEMSQERKDAVLLLVKPRTVQELRAFLGTTNYFRSFIPRFADLAAPLTALIDGTISRVKSKTCLVQWNEPAERAFEDVRAAIANAQRLSYLNPRGEVKLYTDASDYAIGAHLVQDDDAKVEKTIAFFSKSLNDTQRRWNVTEKEMYAVVAAVQKLHTYIGGRPFTIMTDHRNLTFWRNMSASSKVERWKQLLSTFDYTWQALPGEQNCVADTLSRLHSVSAVTRGQAARPPQVTNDAPQPQVPSAPMADVPGAASRSPAASSPPESDGSDDDAPPAGPPVNLAVFHGDVAGHYALDVTLRKMRQYGFKWPGMQRQVSEYIQSCPTCQRTSMAPYRESGPGFHLDANRPHEMVAVDLMGEYEPDSRGNKYIIVFIDHFSGFCRLFPMRSKSAAECGERLMEYVCRDGTPRNLCSDQGAEFVNSTIEELLKFFKVPHRLAIAYSHQDQAKVERLNREVRVQLKRYVMDALDSSQQLPWSLALPVIERILNTRVSARLQCTPAEVHYGIANALDIGIFQEMAAPTSDSPSDFVQKIKTFQERILLRHQQLARPVEETEFTVFSRGDVVMVRRPTTTKANVAEPYFSGPFTVLGQQNGEVSVESYETHRPLKVHVSRCRPYYSRSGDPAADVRLAQERRDEWPVEAIVGHEFVGTRRTKANLRLQVKWCNFPDLTEEKGSNATILRTAAFVQYAQDKPDLLPFVLTTLDP